MENAFIYFTHCSAYVSLVCKIKKTNHWIDILKLHGFKNTTALMRKVNVD